jgi:hypothetical protein
MADPIATFVATAPTYMAKLMADFGFSLEDAAAIMGNLGHESNGFTAFQEINPTSGRGGWGWAQWTGPRRVAFEEYVKRNNLDPKSDKANYAHLFNELKGPEKAAVAKTKAADGLYNKVVAFEKAFERAGVKAYNSRMQWAERAMDAYESASIPPPVETEPERPAEITVDLVTSKLVETLKKRTGAKSVMLEL